jgi:hypothetical protein
VRAIAQSIRAAAPAPSMAESLLGVGIVRTPGNRAEGGGSIFDALTGTQGAELKLDNHGLGGDRPGLGNSGVAAGFGVPAAGGPGSNAFGATPGAAPGRH